MNQAALYMEQSGETLNQKLERYLPLVKRVGLHLKGRLPRDVELDDLLQVGMMGLLKAIENFDPSQGASFETYASIRIRGAMLDEVRKFGWSPRSALQKNKRVSEAIRRAELNHGREATDSEIAAEMEVSLEDYYSISRDLVAGKPVSLDTDQEDFGRELLSNELSPEENTQDSDFREAIKKAIESLPEKEKLVMSLYYNDELNLREIGAVLSVSESRVCQIHGQALSRTRSRIKEWVD